MKRRAHWSLLVASLLLVGGGAALRWLDREAHLVTETRGPSSRSGEAGEGHLPPGLMAGSPVRPHVDPAVGFRLPFARTGWVVDRRLDGVAGVRVHLEADEVAGTSLASHLHVGFVTGRPRRAEGAPRRLDTFVSGADGRFDVPARWSAVCGRLVAEPGPDHTGAVCQLDAASRSGKDLVLQVAPAGVVRGRVVRADGAPGSGRIACMAWREHGRKLPIAWTGLDVQGHFEALAPAAQRVEFQLEDLAGAVWTSLPSEREADGSYTVRVPASRPGAVRGLVRWSHGPPAPHMALAVAGRLLGGGMWSREVVADREGRWALTDAPRLVEVFVTARANAGPGWTRATNVASDDQDITVDLVLPPCRTITVRVEDTEHRPLEGIRLVYWGHPNALAATDATGRIALDGVRSDVGSELGILAPGWRAADGAVLPLRLPADEGTDPRELLVVLTPLDRQVIKVRDTRGSAVAGATVLLVPSAEAWFDDLLPGVVGTYVPGVTDAGGGVEVLALPPGTECDVHVRRPEGGDHLAHFVVAKDLAPLHVRLPTGGPLWGRVLDEAGDPLPHVPLHLSSAGTEPSTAATGPDGRFRFPCTEDAASTLRAERGPAGDWMQLEVDVPGGRPATGLDLGDLRATCDDASPGGWVESATGEPRAGVAVACRTTDGRLLATTTSGDQGYFHFWIRDPVVKAASRLRPVELRLQAAGGEPVAVHVPGPAVRLVQGGPLRALAFKLSSSDGEPLVSGELEVSYTSTRHVPGWKFPIERGEVRVDLPADVDRPVSVCVREARDGKGRATLSDWSETVEIGEEDRVDLVVPAGRTLRGRLVEADGETPVQAGLELRFGGAGEADPFVRGVTVDALGRFEVEALPDLEAALATKSNTWVLAGTGVVRVRPGGEPLLLVARRARQLAVVLTRPDGAPVRGAIVEAAPIPLDPLARPGTAVTDAKGRATIRELPHAAVRVGVRGASVRNLGNLSMEPIEVGPEVGEVDIALRPAASISGHVASPGDIRPRDLRVEVRSLARGSSAETISARVGEDGSFVVGPLEPGPHAVRAALVRGARASAWREVTAPADRIELALAAGGVAAVRIEGDHRELELVVRPAGGSEERRFTVQRALSGDLAASIPIGVDGGTLLVVDARSGHHARIERLRPGDDVTLTLERGSPTRGRLPRVAWPFRPRYVSVEATDGLRRVHGTLDDAARLFSFPGLPPGRWVVEARVAVDRLRRFRAEGVEPGDQGVRLEEVGYE
ncbi:MAG: hypothetical protein AB7T63_16995 [Planctomycetota bacterium]